MFPRSIDWGLIDVEIKMDVNRPMDNDAQNVALRKAASEEWSASTFMA